MLRKTTADYVKVLRVLIERLGDVVVEGFVVDFEKAIWRALGQTFPGVQVKGCVFHWTQAVWRKVQQYGLATAYMERTEVHAIIRQLLALPFLPPNHIRPTFEDLKTKATTEQLQPLVHYKDKQWFTNSVYDVENWSVYEEEIQTNNDCEGWHHRLNGRAGMSGLGFYCLVPLQKWEAALMEIAIQSGDLQRDRRGTSDMLEGRLRELWRRYMAREISTSRFLKACGELYGVQVGEVME